MSERRGPMLVLLGTAFFMTVLDGTSLLTALPEIETGLHLHGPAVQWTVTAYALAFAGPLLPCGRAADLYGRRRMFLAGMTLRLFASLLCGFAPNAGMLVAGRALQGLSAAIIAPAALSMVMTAFPEGPERNRALGVWGGLGGTGATAGLLLGGLLTATLGWPWVFWINLPVGLAVLTFAPGLLPESRGRKRPIGLTGAGALTLAATLLVYAITRPPASPAQAGGLAAAAGAASLFVVAERRTAFPLVPLRALRERTLLAGNAVILVAGMAVDGMLVTLTSYAQRQLGWPAPRFGLVAAVMTATSVAAALVAQRYATRVGVRRVAATNLCLLAGTCALLTVAGSTAAIAVALLVFGAGMGGVVVSAQISALTGVAEEHAGLAAAMADSSFALGTALGVAICGNAGRAGFAAAGGCALLGLLPALALLAGRVQPDSANSATVRHDPGASEPARRRA
jgi:MFS family permease